MCRSIEQLLRESAEQLKETGQPRFEAELLLAMALEKPRSFVHAWPEHTPDPAQQAHFLQLVADRKQGVPVAYLAGQREFWSLQLDVDESTLIPRPETELLVEQALALIPASRPMIVADLGTGSGAIAMALASERPHWRLIGVERSEPALRIARRNRRRLNLDNVSLCRASWCDSLATASLDAIVSNPPYVASNDVHLSRGDVRFEPRTALAAGPDGLDDIRQLVPQARRVLKPAGWLLVEHSAEQAEQVNKLMKNNAYTEIQVHRDLAGRERVSSARCPG